MVGFISCLECGFILFDLLFSGMGWGGLASVAVCYVFVALIVVCRAVWFLWVGGYLVFCVWVGL